MTRVAKPPAIFLVLLASSTLVALVPTLYPELDLWVSGYFLKANPPAAAATWWWVELINEHIPTIFRLLFVVCLLAWLVISFTAPFKRWCLPIAFVGLALLMGPGLLVGALKDYTLRARPFHVTEFAGSRAFSPAWVSVNQCEDNCAFVSGHTADGFFLASLMLMDRRRRWLWAAIGVISGLVIGFARVSVGAHWLSDVLWAFPVTLVASWLAWSLLARVYRAEFAIAPKL